MLAPPPRPASPPLTDHALQFHQQVQEAGVTDGHVRLRVSQSNQLHHQLVHPDACSRDRWNRGGGKTQVQKHWVGYSFYCNKLHMCTGDIYDRTLVSLIPASPLGSSHLSDV